MNKDRMARELLTYRRNITPVETETQVDRTNNMENPRWGKKNVSELKNECDKDRTERMDEGVLK